MIYYDENNLIIRSMVKGDIEKLCQGFTAQGWNKPQEQFEHYYNQQESNARYVIVAELYGNVAGYVTLLPNTETGPYAFKNIPEVVDFNVLIKYQNKGIGNKILDITEKLAKNVSDHISLSVGLHSGYGSAQRMYVKRGYIPDGSGVWYDGKQLEPYSECVNDDELTLYFLKALKGS